MNNRHITFVSFMALAAPLAAHAQSSVTLYGVLDAGMICVNDINGAHRYATRAGGYQGNRWGLTGTVDPGGGYQADAIYRRTGRRMFSTVVLVTPLPIAAGCIAPTGMVDSVWAAVGVIGSLILARFVNSSRDRLAEPTPA